MEVVGRDHAQMQLKHLVPNTQFLGWRPTPLVVWGELPLEVGLGEVVVVYHVGAMPHLLLFSPLPIAVL